MVSVYGSLFLAGSMAAARIHDRSTAARYLAESDRLAQVLGADGNHLWTSFGPTNVAIHRAATALELGDIQIAMDLGSTVDTSGLPIERRVRHAMGTAKALSLVARSDDALGLLLDTERLAPEQVQRHMMGRQLVLKWVRGQRTRNNTMLDGLARRMNLV